MKQWIASGRAASPFPGSTCWVVQHVNRRFSDRKSEFDFIVWGERHESSRVEPHEFFSRIDPQ
jgi:hypothetical protein